MFNYMRNLPFYDGMVDLIDYNHEMSDFSVGTMDCIDYDNGIVNYDVGWPSK